MDARERFQKVVVPNYNRFGYGYHLSGPSLLVSTHPLPPTDHGVSTNACLALSIDHDLKRLRKRSLPALTISHARAMMLHRCALHKLCV
jgi:hypothetical protein